MSEFKESPPSAKTQLSKFLNQLYNHPLLDQETIQHRQEFGQKFNGFCEEWRLDSEQVAAVLVGSSIWVAHRGSDWDIILYGPQEVIDRYKKAREDYKKFAHEPDIHLGFGEIHSVEAYGDSELTTLTSLAPLLLAPNNIIAGNVELANQYRSKILDLENPNPNELKKYFEDRIKGWFKDIRKEYRIKAALGQAAIRLGERPDVYESDFQKYIEELELPTFDIFTQAIKETQS